jgi:protein-tyrosine phosphatase
MIDIHCHILHQMDDGPSSLDESIALCQIAIDNHIEKIVATPHIYEIEKLSDFLNRRSHQIDELTRELASSDLNVDLYAGAEVFVTDDIFYFDGLERLTINNSRYLLLEFPYSGLNLNSIYQYISEIQRQGLVPIVAHPERYEYFQREYELINILADSGVLFQVNADSICSPVNKREQRLASVMVLSGMASFLATDAHSIKHRPNNLFEMICSFAADLDTFDIDKMVNVNPEAVLIDSDVDIEKRNRLQKSWMG